VTLKAASLFGSITDPFADSSGTRLHQDRQHHPIDLIPALSVLDRLNGTSLRS
jgi:hypothetical protein